MTVAAPIGVRFPARIGGLLVGIGVLLTLVLIVARSDAQTSAPLNLADFQLTFDEPFTHVDISGRPGSGARWYDHTPWRGDFGEAAFVDPAPGGPFVKTREGMAIVARRGDDHRWTSGLISSRDHDGLAGDGFVQALGYFEMNARLPEGSGTWPAFWLIGSDKANGAAEIDVMEFYGGFPGYYHATSHLWGPDGKGLIDKQFLIAIPKGILSRQFNTFGVLIDPQSTIFYFNRRPVARMKTPPQYREPFYILADLALGGGWPTDHLTSPQTMEIAYIRAYRRIRAEPS